MLAGPEQGPLMHLEVGEGEQLQLHEEVTETESELQQEPVVERDTEGRAPAATTPSNQSLGQMSPSKLEQELQQGPLPGSVVAPEAEREVVTSPPRRDIPVTHYGASTEALELGEDVGPIETLSDDHGQQQ